MLLEELTYWDHDAVITNAGVTKCVANSFNELMTSPSNKNRANHRNLSVLSGDSTNNAGSDQTWGPRKKAVVLWKLSDYTGLTKVFICWPCVFSKWFWTVGIMLLHMKWLPWQLKSIWKTLEILPDKQWASWMSYVLIMVSCAHVVIYTICIHHKYQTHHKCVRI